MNLNVAMQTIGADIQYKNRPESHTLCTCRVWLWDTHIHITTHTSTHTQR